MTPKHTLRIFLALLAPVTVSPVWGDYQSTVTGLGPVGYWRLNEAAAATPIAPTGTALNLGSVGAAADGTYYCITDVGTGPSGVTGDTASLFNPDSALHTSNPEFVEIPNTAALLASPTFSFECWVRRDSLSGSGTALCGGLDTGGGALGEYQGFTLFFDNANSGTRNYYLRLRHSLGGTGTPDAHVNYNARLFGLPDGTTLGEWDHVVYTWDTTTIQGYINGVALLPTSFPADRWYHPSSVRPVRIAMDSKLTLGGTLAKSTWMSHVAIYHTVLTQADVDAHRAAASDSATYEAAVLANSPKGYWQLDETGPFPAIPKDPVTCANLGSWGAGANGTLAAAGDFNTGAPGVPYPGFGGATSGNFTGAGSELLVPAQSLTTSDFTITAWAKIPAETFEGKFLRIPTASEVWFGNSEGNSPGMVNNEVRCTFTGGSGSPSSVYMPSNEWAFVAWVHSASESTIYVNGLGVASGPAGSVADFSSTNLLFGDDFAGSLADVAVFDKTLTPLAIASLYTAAEVPASSTGLATATQVTSPDVNGDFSVSGTAGRGRTVRLWKSTDLGVTDPWTAVGLLNADSLTGNYTFPLNTGSEPKAFFRAEAR